MGDKSYSNYQKRLAGEKVLTFDGDPDCGFYRKPIHSPRNEGRKLIGWERVAYFCDDGKIVGIIGDRDMTDNEIVDLWTYVCAYPVPEDIWRRVDAGEIDWPRNLIGEPKQASRTAYPEKNDIPTATEGRTVERNHNQPEEAELPPEAVLREKIANTIATAADLFDTKSKKYVVNDDEELALAGSYRNLLNESRLAAEKGKEAEFRPLKNQLDAVTNKWNPVINLADSAAKAILTGVNAYNTKKLQDRRAEEAKIAEANRAAEQANMKMLDRAAAKGEAISVEQLRPMQEPTAPAPKATIAVGHGRAMSVSTIKVATIVDQALVYERYKDHADVKALLLKLAQADVTAGNTVPGTTVTEEARTK